MKLYISGPMRGYPQTNFPMFDEVSRYVESCGWTALSPADNDRRVWPGIESAPGFVEGNHVGDAPEGFTFEKLFVWDVDAIGQADGIVLLPGWDKSVGAKLELAVAEAFGKTIMFAVIEDGRCVYVQPHDPAVPTTTIVGLVGYAQSGKDSTAAILADYGFGRVAFADPLREMLYALNPTVRYDRQIERLAKLVDSVGWEGAKQWPEVRRLMQRLGTEAGRQVLGYDVWVRTAMAKVQPGSRTVFTDVRFPNEAEAIKAAGGRLWRVYRPGFGPVNDHPSEVSLNDFEMDAIVCNDGTLDDLRQSVLEVVVPTVVTA